MSLFFDREWFDARLKVLGLSKQDIASALGLTATQLNEMWKDQRELKPQDVRVLSALLGVEPEEIAHRAGTSTPVPGMESTDMAAVIVRLERIEAIVLELREALKSHEAGNK